VIQPIESMRRNRRKSILLLLLLLLIGGGGAILLGAAGSAPPSAATPLITSTPSDPTTGTSATFHYTDSSAGAGFRCSLDGSDFQPCPSGGTTYSNLMVGTHLFRVQATLGRSISQAATFHWTVISAAPYQPVRIPGGTVSLPPAQGSTSAPSPTSNPSSQPPATTLPPTNSINSAAPTTVATTSPTTAASPTDTAPSGAGSIPSVSGNLTSLLYPGTTQLLDLVFTNPNSAPVTVAANGVHITISTNDSACSAANFRVNRGLTAAVTIPANSTESLAQLGVPSGEWPVIGMVDTHTNQDACEGATLTLDYSVTVTG